MSTTPQETPFYQRPAELLQQLIRFDTTNPPGNEAACIGFIDTLLQEAGFETTLLAKDPNRPNLLARLKGRGEAAPLMLYGHVDVVTTVGQQWDHPPFEGVIVDDMLWGRGTLDMKGGVAMMVAAFLRAKAEGVEPAGDILLTILSDEEAGGVYGARFLVEEHPEIFADVAYALGEFGGNSMNISGSRVYMIQVAEKQSARTRMIFRGPGGHGSQRMQDGAMALLGKTLTKLNEAALPARVTPASRAMIEALTAPMPFVQRTLLKQLLNPSLTDRILKLLGNQGALFFPLFHNTINATIVNGGNKINVIPSEIVVELDGRLLPGVTPEQFIAELRGIVDPAVEIEVVHFEEGPKLLDMGLFDLLASVLLEKDPGAHAVPLLLPAVTDGRHFARLGIQSYGFTPMQLPDDVNFAQSIHGANERIPVASVSYGADAIFDVIKRYGSSS